MVRVTLGETAHAYVAAPQSALPKHPGDVS